MWCSRRAPRTGGRGNGRGPDRADSGLPQRASSLRKRRPGRDDVVDDDHGAAWRLHARESPREVGPALAGREPCLVTWLPREPQSAHEAKTRIGLALHRLLQWHPTPALGFDWSAAHVQAVAREFALSPAQATQAQTMARRIVQGEAAWAWDGAVVDTTGNEVDIFHAGELLRLDRLVRRADTGEWWVLDFKSAENPALQPDLLTKMQRYRQAVQSARPGATVRLAFINLHGRLIELQDPSITS
mgnify:CR=1 FL=1